MTKTERCPPQKFSPAGAIRSKFGIDLVCNAGGFAAMALAGLGVNAIVFGFRGSAALGVFNLVYTIYMFVSQLAVGGIHNSVLNYCAAAPGGRQGGKIVYAALLLVFFLSTAVAVMLAFLLPLLSRWYSPDVASGFALTLPGLVLYCLNKVGQMCFNAHSRIRILALLQTLRAAGILLWCGFVLFLGLDSVWFCAALGVGEIPVFLAAALYQEFRLFPLRPMRFSPKLFVWGRRHVIFGARGCLSGVVISANTHVDVIVLGLFVSETTVGIYSFAAMYAEGFSQAIQLLRVQLDPMWGKFFAARDVSGAERLAKKVKLFFWPFMFAAGLAAVGLFPLFLSAVKPTLDTEPCLALFAILVGGYALTAPYKSFIGILLMGNRPGVYTALMTATLCSNAILNVILFHAAGLWGVAAAAVVSNVLQAALIAVFSRGLFGIRL